jgi:hydrogenase maturation protease
VLVVGLGNALRGDDAAGLEAVRRLAEEPGVVSRTHEGEAVGLLEQWDGFDAVVIVDTVRSGARAGTIHRIDASTEPVPSPLRRASSHTIGVGEVIELGRRLGRLPARVVVYGVEGSHFEAGSEMSEPVAAALDDLLQAVRAEARSLGAGSAGG